MDMMAKKKRARAGPRVSPSSSTATFERLLRKASATQRYVLKLFITGTSPRSMRAVENIRALCDEHLAGRYDLEVVDIYQQPTEARGEQIIAAPTLIRKLPKPLRRMVGDLSDQRKVLVGLDLRERNKPESDDGTTQWLKL